MLARIVLVLASAALLSCGGGDKHFPSSNPPEYDPTKSHAPPVTPPTSKPVVQDSKPAEEPALAVLPLEPAPNEVGQWRKLESEKLYPRKRAESSCEALTQLLQGLGSTHLLNGR
ncbi:MAG TPA: hypothetical protein VFR82_08015, partial [Nitrospira sp.]|nr:hypothetical protein [Nitrospira sp.]